MGKRHFFALPNNAFNYAVNKRPFLLKTEINKMKKSVITLLGVSLLAVSLGATAAKPVKITPGAKGVAAGGEKFRNYVVQCSNGKKQPLTSWNNGKKWCVGQESGENCAKKQIKAAKKACKLS